MRGLGIVAAAVAFCCAGAGAQTSVGVSVYGAFSGTTSQHETQASPSNAAGGLLELRHVSNPILGYEATYSWNRANETYTYTGPTPVVVACPVGPTSCGVQPATVKANAHEVTADWVPSLHLGSFRPFGVLGVGALFDVPSGNQSNTQTSTKAVYVYGAGLDWGVLPHLGLRFQYRGNLYKSPDVTKLYSSVDQFTHTAEPMIGAYFNF